MTIGLQLFANRAIGGGGIFERRIDEMQEHPAAFHMAQEADPQSRAFGGALDQPRNVGEDELPVLGTDHPQIWMKGGEGIVGDLRPRPANARKEGRLSCIGQSNQARVCDQLETKPDPALFPRPAGIGSAGCAIGGGLVMRVTEAAVAALGQHRALAGLGQVDDERLLVFFQDLRANRHLDDQRLAGGTGTLAPGTVAAALRLEVLGIAEVDEGIQPFYRLSDHIAAAATIAAVRAAELNVFLAPERAGAGTAVTAAEIDLGFVEKLHSVLPGGLLGPFFGIKEKGGMAHHSPFWDTSSLCCRRALFCSLAGWVRNHRDVGATTRARLEFHAAVDQGVDRVVPAKADTRARLPLGATLAHDDVAGGDFLAAEKLHTQAATGGVAPVARATTCF